MRVNQETTSRGVLFVGKGVSAADAKLLSELGFAVERVVPLGDCFITTGADFTIIKNAETEVRDLAFRLNSHMENSPLAVVEWDREYRIIRWSEEAERTCRLEWRGSPWQAHR